MPTDTHPLSLLLFDQKDPKCPDQDLSVWTWSEWQKITGLPAAPYDPMFNTLVHPSTAIPEKEYQALISFINKFQTIMDTKKIQYFMKNTLDKNQEGHVYWRAWVTRYWKKLGLLRLVEKQLKECGINPWMIMAEDNTQEYTKRGLHLAPNAG
ncbi:hypothetical protein L208DRAFT_1382047 [Tricholoma matsutake]|nr:hypothetical protein L208DRAFT_1382047 [Tricholoma matsutake 945]